MRGHRIPDGLTLWRHPLRVAFLLLISFLGRPAHATESAASILCHIATAQAEHATGVPDQLLDAISRVETGRYDTASGAMRAWPWTINAQGIGHFYASKAEAVAAAQAFQAQGIQSMDVGCMQINLMHHPHAFASLEQAFDPAANAAYAARFLVDLFHQTGSWPHAAAAYHSQTPNLGNDYQRKVLEAWAEPEQAGSTHRNHSQPDGFPQQIVALGTGAGAPVAPAGPPPLGGIGRIIRTGAGSGAGIGAGASLGNSRGLAAYRAMPIVMAGMPLRRARY